MKDTFFILLLLFCGFAVTASENTASEKNRVPTEQELERSVTVEKIITDPRVEFKKGKRIPHLILTSDAPLPSLLAEIARREKGTISVRIPLDGKKTLHVQPARKEDAFELRKEELSRFLAFLNPRQVIFLGGFEHVPAEYRLAVSPGHETAEASDVNWNVNAIILGNYLKLRNLDELFRSEASALKAAAPSGGKDRTIEGSVTAAPETKQGKED